MLLLALAVSAGIETEVAFCHYCTVSGLESGFIDWVVWRNKKAAKSGGGGGRTAVVIVRFLLDSSEFKTQYRFTRNLGPNAD